MSAQEDKNINPLVKRYIIPRGRDAGKVCYEISAKNFRPSRLCDTFFSIGLQNKMIVDEATGHPTEVLESRIIIEPTDYAFVNGDALNKANRWFNDGPGVVIEEVMHTDLVTGELTCAEQLASRWPDAKSGLRSS